MLSSAVPGRTDDFEGLDPDERSGIHRASLNGLSRLKVLSSNRPDVGILELDRLTDRQHQKAFGVEGCRQLLENLGFGVATIERGQSLGTESGNQGLSRVGCRPSIA